VKKTRINKKLVLETERIRLLTPEEKAAVNGGRPPVSETNLCCTWTAMCTWWNDCTA
jgi:hypothetical protein